MPSATSDTFTVGLVQMRCEPDPEMNLEKTLVAIHKAADAGAQIVCTQELFRSHYFCQRQDPALFDLAEPIPGPTTQRLSDAARATETVVVASLFERRAAGVYHNTAVVIEVDATVADVNTLTLADLPEGLSARGVPAVLTVGSNVLTLVITNVHYAGELPRP